MSKRSCFHALSVLALLGLGLGAPTASALEAGPPILETVGHLGSVANGPSLAPRLSPNGRYLAFSSVATNLVPGLGSSYPNIYLRDRQSGVTRRISVSAAGTQFPYASNTPLAFDDGRALFNSRAPLVPGLSWTLPNTGRALSYLYDSQAGTIDLVSRQLNGTPAGEAYIQGNASFVRNEAVLHTSDDLIAGGSLFPSDQVYVRNWLTGAIELISAKPGGSPTAGTVSAGTISPSGRYVVFKSWATDLTNDNPLGDQQLFLRDRVTQTTRRLTFPFGGGEFTTPSGISGLPQFAGDDRSLIFSSTNSELVANGAMLPYLNVYELDLPTGAVTLISVGTDGAIPNGQSNNGQVSADGRYVAFASRATNLTTPSYPDGVYVRDRLTDEIINVSAPLGQLEEFTIPNVSLSADGSTLSFDWWHPSSVPLVGGRTMIYTVTLRGSTPYSPPEPVPTRSWLAMLALMGLLGSLALRRVRQRPAASMPADLAA